MSPRSSRKLRAAAWAVLRAMALVGVWLIPSWMASAKPASRAAEEAVCKADCTSAREKCAHVCEERAGSGRSLCQNACWLVEQECRSDCQRSPRSDNEEQPTPR